ncbi:MAG: histidine--tRNA ligase [Sphingobacteriales bacterium]|nr:MAG: histidine--tRNA ligase [Sphingobacteriales bacterium]TAF78554.1 MAG: histidine--tRNA ligase [Sphingobacteriales bacterium]
MANVKATIPKGTRDFNPQQMGQRNFIFDTLKKVFKKYGYQEIQTPAMESLDTLTGKYGDEGDQLMFKVLNNGDYLSKIDANLTTIKSQTLTSKITEKALRYDLTVPFARYVVMHQTEISLPFKRYQIQPVWRADRPQRGRYREFYQCDVDVVGSNSLLNEAEFIAIYDEALSNLGLRNFTIKINNRKILTGIAEILGKPEAIVSLTVALDKLDKIGFEGVQTELLSKGFTPANIQQLKPLILLTGTNTEKLESLKLILATSPTGLQGINEIYTVLNYLASFTLQHATIELDLSLARGLHYYTGCIFEVKTNQATMGSIGGGGRYDNLTGMFGLQGLTGVGISFGADRIYDVLEELNLFTTNSQQITQVLICVLGKDEETYSLSVLNQLRRKNIAAELYPFGTKIKKQMQYANDKHIAYAIIVGSQEMKTGKLTFKNMLTGQQQSLEIAEIEKQLKTT